MKRTVVIILICALLCGMTSAAAGSAGSSSDPLVSQSYVNNTFTSSVLSEGEKMISAAPSGGNAPVGYTRANGYSAVSLKANGCANLITGSSFMLTSGSAVVKISSGAVIDVSTGSEVPSGSSLKESRRYFCAEDTAAVFSTSAGCGCLIDGLYKLGSTVIEQAPKPKSVVATTLKVKFNGVYQNMEVYNIDGNTYYKLRDIAALMRGTSAEFSVDFNIDTKTIYTWTPGTYTLVGGELQTGTDKSKSCIASPWTLCVNGLPESCYIYNLANNNFFKLRDLGSALGFIVDYDSANRTVLISSPDYTGV